MLSVYRGIARRCHTSHAVIVNRISSKPLYRCTSYEYIATIRRASSLPGGNYGLIQQVNSFTIASVTHFLDIHFLSVYLNRSDPNLTKPLLKNAVADPVRGTRDRRGK